MRPGRTMMRRAAACVFLAGMSGLAACDDPTAAEQRAEAGGPSMLITPACAGTGGQTHSGTTINAAQRWTRAGNPHRVTGWINVSTGGVLTLDPGVSVCFAPGTGIYAYNGGRLLARGRDTARIVLTARDPARGWAGLEFDGSPATPSYLTNARIEHVGTNYVAVSTNNYHGVIVDSTVLRQNGRAAQLYSPGSRLIRSRVDTTTYRGYPAVELANGARFEATVVRRAAGIGVWVEGNEVVLIGGRIEGSGGVGLVVDTELISRYSKAVRVVGGRSYGGQMPLPVLARLYPTAALQDSIRGNARDTLVVTSGELRSPLTVGPRLPLLITSYWTYVDSAGVLTAAPGASFVFRESGRLDFVGGGRLNARGSKALPVLFTADDPAQGWEGLEFYGPSSAVSYLTNTRIEHTALNAVAVRAESSHRVIVDSSVIRQTGIALSLYAPNSRLSRTRVDTTLAAGEPAVWLGGNTQIESTRIRAPAGPGLYIGSRTVVVTSCEIRDGDEEGILMAYYVVPIRNCNLVNNVGPGILNQTSASVDARSLWWGGTGGPAGAGGDGTSGPVVFSPWRTTPFVLPYVP